MAAIGIEVNNVSDRTALWNAFFAWFTKTYSNHGPAWYLIDDQRALGTNPYFVISDQSAPTVNSKAVFLKVLLNSSSEELQVSAFLAWDATNHVGVVEIDRHRITTQTGTMAYYFTGGPNMISIICRIGAAVTHTRLTKWVGIWNATTGKGCEPESASGVLASKAYVNTDPGGYLSGYHNITGYTANLDGSGKLYFNIVSDGGGNFHIDIYSNSARSAKIGHTGTFVAATTGAKGIVADNASGLGGNITTAITVAAATNIDCRFLRVDLQSGQGANFTVGRKYFMTDFTGYVQRISYVKVTAISGDTLTLDFVGARDFQIGANISPYPHRWVMIGSVSLFLNPFNLPYVSNQGLEYQSPSGGGQQIAFDWMQTSLQRSNPDDDGDYALMFNWIVEGASGGAPNNRIWGKEIHVLASANANLNPFTDRRTLLGVPYMCFVNPGGSSPATCIINQESLS